MKSYFGYGVVVDISEFVMPNLSLEEMMEGEYDIDNFYCAFDYWNSIRDDIIIQISPCHAFIGYVLSEEKPCCFNLVDYNYMKAVEETKETLIRNMIYLMTHLKISPAFYSFNDGVW